MKKVIALSLSSLLLFSSAASALQYGEEWNGYTYEDTLVYSDVPQTHWAYDAISKVKDAGWFSGYPDGSFRPSASISREEAMTVMVKFLGLQLSETEISSYNDVDKSRWSSPYIEAGKMLFPNQTTFNGQTPFQPEMPVTREDVMYAMVIAKKYNNEVTFADQSILNMFSDKNSISSDLKGYVATAVKVGLVSGHANGSIGAQDPLTRAEFASMLYRAQGIGDGTGGGLSAVPTVKSITIGNQLVTEMTVGETIQIRASANMSDNTTIDYSSNLSPYNSSANNVVLTNRNEITAMNPGTAVLKFNNDAFLADKELVINVKAAEVPVVDNTPETNVPEVNVPDEDNNETEDNREEVTENVSRDEENNQNTDENTDNEASLVSLQWSIDSLNLNAGETARIKLIGKYSDGSEKDLTTEYSVYVYDEEIAEMENGVVKAISAGETKIGYTGGGVESVKTARPLTLVVSGFDNGDVVEIKWSVDNVEIAAGESKEVKMIGILSNGSEVDVTEICDIFCDDEDIAVFENGVLKAVAPGKTTMWYDDVPNARVKMPRMLNVVVK